jgi:hypothetical protein
MTPLVSCRGVTGLGGSCSITVSPHHAHSQTCTHTHTRTRTPRPQAKIANYTSLYVLGTLEASRAQIQILHEWDNCCFHACGRHERIAE